MLTHQLRTPTRQKSLLKVKLEKDKTLNRYLLDTFKDGLNEDSHKISIFLASLKKDVNLTFKRHEPIVDLTSK